ncbi:MAG: hypothetical protein RJA44_1226 [Pseudomonadota bacterium]
MTQDGDSGRRSRFPLKLKDTAPTARRLVGSSGGTSGRSPAPAPRPSAASGVGLDSGVVRRRMVERLRAQGCSNERVLAAIDQVPRHLFVDTALAGQAYEDTSLPIGYGQTISKPSVVARMLELLCEGAAGSPLRRVLEIGTGCGYQAALLLGLARQVYSVERLRPMYERARTNLAALRADNLCLIYGDGRHGHGPHAPYDGIIAAAAGVDIPAPWLEQLAPLGRLVAPVFDPQQGVQLLVVIDKRADGSLIRRSHEVVRFVPLESGTDQSGRP